ncbi:MAG: tetratricopeptide repeat protein, partial [Methanotrichaceae archaeon]
MGTDDTWKRQGKYLFASGKYDDAIKLLNRVLQKNPEDVDAWMFKGRALYYQRKYADALRCYESALGIDPKKEDCLKEKIMCCDKLIGMSPKNVDTWDKKLGALMTLGRYEEAVQICDSESGFCFKNAPRAWNLKGDALRAKDAYEDALKYYNKTLRQDP